MMTMIQKNSSLLKRLHRHPIIVFLSAYILIFPEDFRIGSSENGFLRKGFFPVLISSYAPHGIV